MDKNYNVDDILSEIKTRKSKEKAAGPERKPFQLSEDLFAPNEDAAPPVGEEEQIPPQDPVRTPADPDPFAEDFHFSGDRAEPEHKPKPPQTPRQRHHENPLDFAGSAESLTDRAKQRPVPPHRPEHPSNVVDFQQAAGQRPPRKQQPGGFDAFRPLSEAELEDDQHTRILPVIPADEAFGEPEPEEKGRFGFRKRIPREDDIYEEDGEYQDNTPEHSAVDFSEYNSRKDRRDVAIDIARVKLWLFIRGGVTLVITFILFWFVLAGRYEAMPMIPTFFPEPETMRAFLLACTVLTGALALVNSSSVGGGLISLFKMRANSDTLASLAVLAAVAQGVVGVVKPESIDATALSLYFPMAALSMLFGVLGKMTMINRIQTNFRIIASDRKKKALLRVEDADFCREFVPDATRKPTIAYAVQSEFFTDFLGLSYSDKYDVGINRSVAPVCLIGSVVVAVICFLLTESTLSAVSALTAILCVSATFSATFIENIPLGKLTKKLAPLGGMVSGNKAVEDFCDTAAVVLTENDLFPEGHIRLRGIWTFSQGRIDESIIDAASVLCSLDGALSPVFMEIIGGEKKLLKKVDNIVYENNMGVSAWVDSRRVLIGNRLLMQNHGITIPAESKRITQTKAPEDGEMLYLSSSGEVTAQFMVSYHIDDDLAAQLDILAAKDKMLIIHANDANINPHRIWELYGYPEDLIEILPAERHHQYREMIAPRENAIAEIVYTGKATAMVGAILACINARSSILSATLVQLLQIVLGYGLIAFMAFMGAIGSLTILQMTIYQLFWFVVIFVVQKAKQP